MAALALDDLMDKKKEPPPILDLSQSVVNSKEELDQLLARVPEYKIRPEKVLKTDVLLFSQMLVTVILILGKAGWNEDKGQGLYIQIAKITKC